MRVVIGPVSVASANAWLDYADEVIDELASMAPGECFTTPEVLQVFRAYVTSWRSAAAGSDFLWEREIPPEQVEGPSSAAFAAHLSEFWPGRDPLG